MMVPIMIQSVTSPMISPEIFSRRARNVAVHSPDKNASAIITP
jgi:hypothetical protein